VAGEKRVRIGQKVNSDYPFLWFSLVIGTASIVDLGV